MSGCGWIYLSRLAPWRQSELMWKGGLPTRRTGNRRGPSRGRSSADQRCSALDESPDPKRESRRNNRDFLLAQRAHQFQVRFHQLRRSKRHLLVKRNVGVVVAPGYLQKTQAGIAGILDIVAHGEWYVAHVTRPIVESARLAGGSEHAHAGLAFGVILPFVGVRMPMQLAHPTEFDLDQGGGAQSGPRIGIQEGSHLAERVRKVGGITLHSIGQAALQRNVDLTRDLGFIRASFDVTKFSDLSVAQATAKRLGD